MFISLFKKPRNNQKQAVILKCVFELLKWQNDITALYCVCQHGLQNRKTNGHKVHGPTRIRPSGQTTRPIKDDISWNVVLTAHFFITYIYTRGWKLSKSLYSTVVKLSGCPQSIECKASFHLNLWRKSKSHYFILTGMSLMFCPLRNNLGKATHNAMFLPSLVFA